MTPIGNYIPKNGLTNIDLAEFMTTNWPLLCNIVELLPAPLLTFVGKNEDPGHPVHTKGVDIEKIDSRMLIRLAIEPHTDRYNAFLQSRGSCLSTLWSTPAGIIRHILLAENCIEYNELLDEEAALLGGLPYELVDKVGEETEREIGSSETSLYKYHFDERIVEIGVETYMTKLPLNAKVNIPLLRELILLTKSETTPGILF